MIKADIDKTKINSFHARGNFESFANEVLEIIVMLGATVRDIDGFWHCIQELLSDEQIKAFYEEAFNEAFEK